MAAIVDTQGMQMQKTIPQQQHNNQQQEACQTPGESIHSQSAIHTHFESFTSASDLPEILSAFEALKAACGATNEGVYTTIKDKVSAELVNTSALWKLLDTRMGISEYSSNNSKQVRAVIIGSGIAGLCSAIELALLGAESITIVEKRTHYTRHNALHIWPATIDNLRSIGVKYFYPKFCVGQINHVSIRQLQCALTKTALLLGVKFIIGKEFLNITPPGENGLWNAEIVQPPPPSSLPQAAEAGENAELELTNKHTEENSETIRQAELIPCNILIGADGEKSRVCDQLEFERKVFQGGRAIGITANFENTGAADETNLNEFGLLSIYNQEFFAGLKEKDIDLENLVFYRDETHYFVMTAKKQSLLKKGVLKADFDKNAELLHTENVDLGSLKNFVREVARYCKVPDHCELVKNCMGLEDLGIFDFSRKLACNKPAKVLTPPADNASTKSCLVAIVGDALVEPFWPLGTGANRAVFGAMDTAWLVKNFMEGAKDQEGILSDAQVVYDVLQISSPEDLKQGFRQYTIDPQTRYKFAVTGMAH